MKSEKGVTLTALVTYIIIFMIVLSIMATISASFYKNVTLVTESPRYISEFNKFSMFFVLDVKNNTEVTSITSTNLVLEDGTTYQYSNGIIYRNGEQIAKYIQEFCFTQSTYTDSDGFEKQIINITATIGQSDEVITRDIDFVLKYW